MRLNRAVSTAVIGAALLAAAGCAAPQAPGDYATQSDLSALRSELMSEIQKAQDSAAASAAAAERSADDARVASEKADAVFRKSLRK